MVGNLTGSLEMWQVPISVGTAVVVVFSVIIATWRSRGALGDLNNRLGMIEANLARVQTEMSLVQTAAASRDVEWARVSSDVQYIVQSVDEIKKEFKTRTGT